MRTRVAHQLDAVALLEGNVDDHRVGREFLDRGTRIARRFGLAAHRQIVFLFDETAQPLPHDRMIVDQQYAPDLPVLGEAPARG